jgi:FlaA1/EpsC-like NDP-sugar epimerase
VNALSTLLNRVLASSRRQKQLILVTADALAIPAVLWLTWTQLAGYWWLPIRGGIELLGLASVFAVGSLALTGVYRAVVRAFDESFLRALFNSLMLYIVGLIALLTLSPFAPQPFSAAFLSTVLSASLIFFWVWGSRTAIRTLGQWLTHLGEVQQPVVIYGAGAAGRQLLAALRRETGFRPVAFLDDDVNLQGSVIAGLPVRSGTDAGGLLERHRVKDVFIAMPGSSRQARAQVIRRLEPFGVHVRALPGIDQLARGRIQFSDLQEVDIDDLLGRESVPPRASLFNANIAGLNVMVTGAGGSIGSELCRQILKAAPRRLVVLEHSEYALYAIDQELQALTSGIEIVPVLCTVLDQIRVEALLREHEIHTIYHAAAYKHVPLVEANPFEGVRNNALGTYRLAKAALAADVATMVLISTDKAVRPTNVMGASKRVAELVLQAFAAAHERRQDATRFTMVRFGNVLGSSGSVVPLFRKQIANGGPITLTHTEVTRYFMTIPEAAQLVIQAGAMGKGGDVFVLDMGQPIRIMDLARLMIRLSGLSERTAENPEGDIAIECIGLRPGEKLYEELLIGNGRVEPTEHEKILKAFEARLSLTEVESLLTRMQTLSERGDVFALRQLLSEVVEGYPAPTERRRPVTQEGADPGLGEAIKEPGLPSGLHVIAEGGQRTVPSISGASGGDSRT